MKKKLVFSADDEKDARNASDDEQQSHAHLVRPDYGELLFLLRVHPQEVNAAFGAAFVLLITGVVSAIGSAITQFPCTAAGFTPLSISITLLIICVLELAVFVVVYVNERRFANATYPRQFARDRVRNVIFLLTIGLVVLGQWLKWSTTALLECSLSGYSVASSVGALGLLLWYTIILWSDVLTH